MIIVKNSNFLVLKVGNSQSAFKTVKIYIDFKILDHKGTDWVGIDILNISIVK